MTGNPTTDQYAAMVRDKREEEGLAEVTFHANHFVEMISAAIPNLDAQTIGEVLLHVGAGLGGVFIGLCEAGYPPSEAVVMCCNIVVAAGESLYSNREDIE